MSIKSAVGFVCALAALFTAVAYGAPFDERIKAPKITASRDLQIRLKAHFDTVDRKQQEGPGAFIRDRAAYKQWSDLYFSVTRAMDESLPLMGLADLGLVANPDRSYTVDLKKYPQWEPLDSRLQVLTNPAVLKSYVPALKARGFRDADVDTLRTYVATHDPQLAALAEGKQLIDTFAQRLQKRKAVNLPLDLNEIMAYRYQKDRVKQEARRQWAVDLLDTLDHQRQRILVSFFEEEFESKLAFGVPLQPLDRTLEREVQPLFSGEYAQHLAQTEMELRRDLKTRAEKLMEGQQQ